ncbi:unnamed protein product, partial [Rotaria magnacalcarata]
TSKNYGTPPPTDVAVHSKAMRGTSPKRGKISDSTLRFSS